LRALVTTDLHSSDRAARAVEQGLSRGDVDCHLCLGDIITFRPMEYLEELFASPPVPTYTVPGNTDSDEARSRLEELGLDIHFRQVRVGEVTVAGAGGCTPPPFRTAFVVDEEEYATRLPAVLEGAQVLASHGPPRGILDRSLFGGMRVGSRAMRSAIAEARPRVVLTGHIHEARGAVLLDWAKGEEVARDGEALGTDDQGTTLFFNPGPAKDGYLGLLDVDGDVVRVRSYRI
jgi:Icc-related predicted phosphoesterase